MGESSADVDRADRAQREELTGLVRAGRRPSGWCCGRGSCCWRPRTDRNTAIGARSGASCADTVRKWRHRWATQSRDGVAGRCETLRSTAAVHPGAGGAGQGAGLPAPPDVVVPLSRWCCPELARQAVTSGDLRLALGVHRAPVARPRTRSNRGSTSPGSSSVTPTFAGKAARVLDLYAGTWNGAPPGRRTST